MAGGRNTVGAAGAVTEEHEAAGPRRPRIELAQPPRRRVPRVHELALSPHPLLFVEALEPVERQVDLAANLEALRESVSRKPQGDGTNRAHVRGHVFAPCPVPARRGHREAPVLVAKAQRDPVELGLGRVLDLLPFREPEALAHAPVEVGDSRLLEGIGEGEHGDLMDHLRKPLCGGAADPLRGGIGIGQPGVRGLQREELREEAVVHRVRDLRRVPHVVEMVVAGDDLAKLGRAPNLVGRCGAGLSRPLFSGHSGPRARDGARNGPRARAEPGSPAR